LRLPAEYGNIITMSPEIRKKFIWAGLALVGILAIGTLGYWLIGGRQNSFLDVFYMTFITITTIGFGEILDFSSHPAARAFTIFIAVCGVGIMLYVVTNFTALVVEGELTESFRRRRMEKVARNSKHHYIVCGLGQTGFHIVTELHATKRPHVVIDINRDHIDKALEAFKGEVFVMGDATDSDTLLKAGIENARGIFAVTGDDNRNLVITITAKQLNPHVRVVTRCHDTKNSEKMKKAGADAVVSPSFIGGLRMASEMTRPTVVSFLDMMLRDKEKNLRVEEVAVPDSFVGKAISALNLKKYPHMLLLAVKAREGWIYNPSDNYMIKPGDTLIFMATPEEKQELERVFHSDGGFDTTS
jgi:voltage-gated potassium channel